MCLTKRRAGIVAPSIMVINLTKMLQSFGVTEARSLDPQVDVLLAHTYSSAPRMLLDVLCSSFG